MVRKYSNSSTETKERTPTKLEQEEKFIDKMSSLLPLVSKTSKDNGNTTVWYGDPNHHHQYKEETELLVGIPGKAHYIEFEVAEVISKLFDADSKDWNNLMEHPKTNPKRPPTKRFKRHRNFYIYMLNQFRHWWKTSRLLVRVSGGY